MDAPQHYRAAERALYGVSDASPSASEAYCSNILLQGVVHALLALTATLVDLTGQAGHEWNTALHPQPGAASGAVPPR